MANLKEIRSRITSVKTTQQMTRAMKMVAAAKLRRAQDNILRLRPYALKLQEIMGDISANMGDDFESPYGEVREPKSVLLVAVTSNRGLCGAFNNNIIKQVTNVINGPYAEQYKAGKVQLLCIGKKVFEFYKRRDHDIIEDKNFDVFQNLSFETVAEVAEAVMDGFVKGTWDRVDLIYNEFKNVVTQEVRREQFLPISGEDLSADEGAAVHHNANYIFEPGQDEILADLIPKSLKTQFYKSVLESNAGEQGARMTAMDNATENAAELLGDLRLKYNRARQAAITTEILEIVAGAEALGS